MPEVEVEPKCSREAGILIPKSALAANSNTRHCARKQCLIYNTGGVSLSSGTSGAAKTWVESIYRLYVCFIFPKGFRFLDVGPRF